MQPTNPDATQTSTSSQPEPPTNTPVSPPSVAPPTQHKNSLLWLWISLGVGIPILLLAAVFTYFIFFSPTARASSIATNYMRALSSNDKETIAELTGEPYNEFQRATAERLSGATSSVDKVTFEESRNYTVRMSVAESDSVKATSVGVDLGKRTVTKLIINPDRNAEGPTAESQSEPTNTAVTAADSADRCVTLDEIHIVNPHMDEGGLRGLMANPAGLNVAGIFFQPDSIEYAYDYDTIGIQDVDKIIDFHTATPNKQYTIAVAGSVYEQSMSDAGKALAQRRADKIKATLISRGVAEEKISTDTSAHNFNPESGNTFGAERNVSIYLQIPESCANQSAAPHNTGR